LQAITACSKQASRQAGKQASWQAGKQASRQAGKQAGKQASKLADHVQLGFHQKKAQACFAINNATCVCTIVLDSDMKPPPLLTPQDAREAVECAASAGVSVLPDTAVIM